MIDIQNIETSDLQFEISRVDPTASQLIRNIEQFYDSALIIISSEGFLEYFNSRAVKLFELESEITDNKLHFKDLLYFLAARGDFGPGDPDTFVAVASDLLLPEAGAPQTQSQSYLTMPSSNILRVLMYRNSDGSITLSAHDVSDQRRKENILEMALDIGFAGYIIFDTLKKTRRLESRYMASLLTDSELDTLQTSGLFPLLHPDDVAQSKKMWDCVCSKGQTKTATLRVVTEKQGVRWFRFVLMPESESPKSTRVVSFFNDVTEPLRQQENLRQAKIVAEKSLSSKEDFLARMSHEIRTPMNAVIGMADALIHHHADPNLSPQLELIQKSAVSILKLLDETLNHSRLGADSFELNPVTASPAEVVRDVCALWEQQALKNNGVIRCLIKDDVPDTILFDKFRYEQCVNNLLSNAVKFTDGGKIDVILTVVEKKPNTRYLVLAVRDTGIGMTREQQSHIFEAYTQADKSISSRFGGTGLGMNITKQIVDRMDGTISVRSEIGSGTMFAMSVPIMLPSEDTKAGKTNECIGSENPIKSEEAINNMAEAAPSPSSLLMPEPALTIIEEEASSTSLGLVEQMLTDAQPEATAYSELRVLVVDDNPTNHLVVKSLLGSVVGDVIMANNGSEALEKLDSTPIDIVLMDIHMPVMDGIECTLAIRSSDKPWKDVTIIALTADPQYQQKQLCINIGMDEALAKPVRLNDLLQAIDSVLPNINSSKTDHFKTNKVVAA